MPTYVFHCDKCDYIFEEMHGMSEDLSKVKCEKCKKKTRQLMTCPHILGPTSSKLDNFSYRAGYNYDKATKESSTAREEAARRGINPGYKSIDDISSGQHFDPESW